MTIKFINIKTETLQTKIQQLIYTGAKLSPKLASLLQKVLHDGEIKVHEVPSGTLIESADWNKLSRVIRLESSDASLLHFLFQLTKAGNYHFTYIKSPSEFFTAKEYARYIESIYMISSTLFYDIMLELKPHCETLSLPSAIIDQKCDLYHSQAQGTLLDSMLAQPSSEPIRFNHIDIYSAQWDKFMLIEKIRKINEVLEQIKLDINTGVIKSHQQSELLALFESLYHICTKLDLMDFLSEYAIPENFYPELLSEIDSFQPTMQFVTTLEALNLSIDKLERYLPEKLIPLSETSSSSGANNLFTSLMLKLEKIPSLKVSKSYNMTTRSILVSRDLYKDKTESAASSTLISTLGFDFDSPSQLAFTESDYRSEFIDSLSNDDDLLREFQISYFDDLLANYRINCLKAKEGKTDFIMDSQNEVIDLNLLKRQIIPKSKLNL